uniref:Uncharacterized protein n=1 Tax=Vitis vinifera TaxID=29760 RepID=F6H7Q1_VITVI
MEELLGRVKQGFWMFTGLNFKWKHEHKQWEHNFARSNKSKQSCPRMTPPAAKRFHSGCVVPSAIDSDRHFSSRRASPEDLTLIDSLPSHLALMMASVFVILLLVPLRLLPK